MLGRYQGSQNAIDLATLRADTIVNQKSLQRIEYLEQELSRIQLLLGSVEKENKALAAKSIDLEKAVDTSLGDAIRDSADLELYRRIERSDAAPGSIAIDEVVLQNTQPLSVGLTLVQWRGREKVAGKVSVSANQFSRGESAVLSKHSLSADRDSFLPVDFQFRFFQKVSVPVPIDPDNPPDFIEIEVKTKNLGHHGLVKRVDWTELSEIVD